MKTTTPIKTTLKGYPSLKVLDADGNVVEGKTIDPYQNVITNFGRRELIFSGTQVAKLFSTLHVQAGTGTTEITATSTNLGIPSGTRASTTNPGRTASEVDNLDGTSTSTIVHTGSYAVGEITGTLSEIGIFSATTGENLCAGQLIKDGAGNPTTVTVLATEQLVIEYTLEFTYPNVRTAVTTGSVTDSFGTHNYTIYASPYFYDTATNRNYLDSPSVSDTACSVFDSTGTEYTQVDYNLASNWLDNLDNTYTLATDTITFAPTDFAGAFRYLTFGAGVADPLNVFRCPATVEFDTYPNKQSNESLTFDFSITMSVA